MRGFRAALRQQCRWAAPHGTRGLVISVALGPARAVGGMSLMYPLLPVSAAADPSPVAHETSIETSGTRKDTSCGPSG